MVNWATIGAVMHRLRVRWLRCALNEERRAQGRWRQLPLVLALLLPVAASSRERETLEKDYEKATSQALAGDWAGALTNANRAIYLQPYAAEAWFIRAEALQNLGNLPEAITNFSLSIALRPLASSYFRRGMIEQHLDPQSPAALADYNEAIRLTERLTEQPPDPHSPVLNQTDYSAAFYNRGCLKGIHGDTDGALADFDRAIRLNPELGLAYSCRAMIKMNRRDGAAALADFSRAIELHSTNPNDYYNRGLLLAYIARTPFSPFEKPHYPFYAAIRDFEKAHQLDPNIKIPPEFMRYDMPELKWYQFMTWHQWQLMAVIVIIGGFALRAVRRRREATTSGPTGAGK